MITLEEAVASGRVFVRNQSQPKGTILMTFIEPGSGKSSIVTIPKTWIPIAVSDTMPLRTLQDSIDFRSYLVSKMLVLIPREEAENILNSEDAKEEQERLYSSKHIEEEPEAAGRRQKQQKRRELLGLNDEDEESAGVDVQAFIRDENLMVKDILERNVDNKVSITLNELRSIEEELGHEDLVYVIKNSEGKIRSWAEKKLGDKEKQVKTA